MVGFGFFKKGGGENLEAFYPIKPECQANVPKPRFKPRSGKTLSARRWHASFSEDGHLDIAKVLRRIQRGGIHPAIKGLVWEFLLGCFDPNSTFEDRNQLRQSRRQQYNIWKTECQNMVPVIGSGQFITTPIITDDGQPVLENTSHNEGVQVNSAISDEKIIQWMLNLHQIGLDVVRTDQTLVFYESKINQAKLWDILSVYAWVDTDIGYMQGMNDICSPMVILLENEADAFWCFEHAMKRLRGNFRCSASSIGVQTQLGTLSQVIKTVDPKLHQHLEELDGGEYLFAFRMLMVLFRREFSFVDTMYLWELMWAMEYNPNIFSIYEEPAAEKSTSPILDNKQLKQYGKFVRKNAKTGSTGYQSALAVFLVASVLETKNKKILKDAKGLDDVVEILADVTGNLDAKKVCTEALKIHKKYLNKRLESKCLYYSSKFNLLKLEQQNLHIISASSCSIGWNFSATYWCIQIGAGPMSTLIHTAALKLAPDRKKFVDIIGSRGNINSDMENFCTNFSPFLEENLKFLASVVLDKMKACGLNFGLFLVLLLGIADYST